MKKINENKPFPKVNWSLCSKTCKRMLSGQTCIYWSLQGACGYDKEVCLPREQYKKELYK